MYVLHHVPDRDVDRAVNELARVVVPGGVVMVGGHIGNSHALKTSGYGEHAMHVELNRRPAAFWEAKVRDAGLAIEAHTVYDGDGPSPSHAIFCRKTHSTAE